MGFKSGHMAGSSRCLDITFRHDGQVSEAAFHNPGGSVGRSVRVYDDDGRIIEEQFWKDDGPKTRKICSYDALGRLAAVEDVAPDGTRREAETCWYDDAGRKTKVTFLSHNADIPILYGVEGAEHAYGAPGA